MSEAENLQQLKALYPQILIKELIEKTKGCAVVWNKPRGTTFYADWSVNTRFYQAYLSYLGGTYRLDILRNNRAIYSVDASDVPDVSVLYQIVDHFLSQNEFLRPTLVMQKQIDCQSIFYEYPMGGVVLGGRAVHTYNETTSGGVEAAGVSPVVSFLPFHGGIVLGGSAIDSHLDMRVGGVVMGGSALVSVAGVGDIVQTVFIYPDSDVEYQFSNSEMQIFNPLLEEDAEPIPPAEAWPGLDFGLYLMQFRATDLPSTLGLRVGLEDMPVDFDEAVQLIFEMTVYGSPATYYELEVGIVDSLGNELIPFTTPRVDGVNPSIYKFIFEVTDLAITDLDSWNDAILVLNFNILVESETFYTIQYARVVMYYA